MRYLHLKTDGTVEQIISRRPLSLERLQELVGGYIEAVPLRDGHTLMVNEEGLVHNLPVNPHVRQEETDTDITAYGLRGDVVLGRDRDDGEFVGVEAGYTREGVAR